MSVLIKILWYCNRFSINIKYIWRTDEICGNDNGDESDLCNEKPECITTANSKEIEMEEKPRDTNVEQWGPFPGQYSKLVVVHSPWRPKLASGEQKFSFDGSTDNYGKIGFTKCIIIHLDAIFICNYAEAVRFFCISWCNVERSSLVASKTTLRQVELAIWSPDWQVKFYECLSLPFLFPRKEKCIYKCNIGLLRYLSWKQDSGGSRISRRGVSTS